MINIAILSLVLKVESALLSVIPICELISPSITRSSIVVKEIVCGSNQFSDVKVKVLGSVDPSSQQRSAGRVTVSTTS
jgi:hypothetical protein